MVADDRYEWSRCCDVEGGKYLNHSVVKSSKKLSSASGNSFNWTVSLLGKCYDRTVYSIIART